MPYFVYNIQTGATALIKTLALEQAFDAFKDAKQHVSVLREQDAQAQYKIIFAQNELEAEERLQEYREAPILAEWEK